ncbi:MAG TPA: carboxylating nicotinate-nucleotide diphosphorylase [Planctomycetota bacterium]|nr:carboxylating nicotinate-nucleotide diphosphorylase [Planctomycetota bacterium]
MHDPCGFEFSESLSVLVRLALEEDAVDRDVTALSIVPETARGRGVVLAKQEGVVAGLPLLRPESPLMRAFPSVAARSHVPEGSRVAPGTSIAECRGSARELLGLERTLLNFLQRLSGIATATAACVAAAGPRTRVQETRKTCPGWRELDKYAVRVGGGLNHRRDLSAQILVKENHLIFAGVERSPEAVRAVIRDLRAKRPGMLVEVEAETLEQVDAAFDAGADVVLLDDMTSDQHAEAVRRRNARCIPVLLEVSGGVTPARLPEIAATGVDRVSIGALTHSVKALDLSMDLRPE